MEEFGTLNCSHVIIIMILEVFPNCHAVISTTMCLDKGNSFIRLDMGFEEGKQLEILFLV